MATASSEEQPCNMIGQAGDDQRGGNVVQGNAYRPFCGMCLMQRGIQCHQAGNIKIYGKNKRQCLRLGDGGGDDLTDIGVCRTGSRGFPDRTRTGEQNAGHAEHRFLGDHRGYEGKEGLPTHTEKFRHRLDGFSEFIEYASCHIAAAGIGQRPENGGHNDHHHKRLFEHVTCTYNDGTLHPIHTNPLEVIVLLSLYLAVLDDQSKEEQFIDVSS